jgi:cytochrome c oxidase subunit 1
MSEQHIHPEPTTFVMKYWFSHDHKMIAKQFLWLGLFFLAWGGMMAMLIRWQLANPGQPFPVLGNLLLARSHGIVTPSAYTTLFTMHGLIMIFWAITPILIGFFGNYCIPLMIGARDMAFPTLNMLSFHTMFVASVILICSFLVPMGSGAAGWTTYPPLSTQVGTPGWGQTLTVLAIFFAGVATIMGSINYVTTVIRLRAPGMGWFQMPLTVWGLWLTAVLNVLFVPVLGSAALLLLLDRTFGTEFYLAGAANPEAGGDPILFQHLFWIFGHPEVYILILPAWGIISDLLAFFARKPAYWYKGTALGMTAVTILSAVVYGHHMFVTGMNPMLGKSFMLLTLIISVPAEVFFLNWLHTLWKGSIRWTVPMAFAVGVVFVFGLGGLTGLFLGTISTDLYLHDTYFVVGHFHLTMAAAAFLGSFAGIYFWFPKCFGRMMNPTLGKAHFWLSFLMINAVFCGQLVVGWGGMQRRLYDPNQYVFLAHLLPVNRFISYAAFILGVSQLLFVYNFISSLIRGEKASDNPWEVGTLEWSLPSPPKHYNYDPIPVVHHGPHEFANPKVKGKDWLGQWEPPDAIGGPPAEEKKAEEPKTGTDAAE